MVGIDKKEIINSLEALRSNICCYLNSSAGCDCKYGYKESPTGGSEKTCCPELRLLIQVLSTMSDEEFYMLLRRNVFVKPTTGKKAKQLTEDIYSDE